MSWEDTLRTWSTPPGEVEQSKAENAERAVHKAIAASSDLSRYDITVFAQGSYRNRTNVRLDSDVDIGVLCPQTFLYDLPEGLTREQARISPATYGYSVYKNDVERALISHFGRGAVTRGNKAFDVHENTYRVDADVVACFPYRLYGRDGTFREGRALITDNGSRIHNWPEQNYANGVAKNDATNRGFKALVRILKRLRNKMADEGIAQAIPIPSYLLECLVWNVPDEGFTHPTYMADLRYVLAHLFNNTIRPDNSKDWTEINGVKYLFHATQPWTVQQVHAFVSSAWDHVGFK